MLPLGEVGGVHVTETEVELVLTASVIVGADGAGKSKQYYKIYIILLLWNIVLQCSSAKKFSFYGSWSAKTILFVGEDNLFIKDKNAEFIISLKVSLFWRFYYNTFSTLRGNICLTSI